MRSLLRIDELQYEEIHVDELKVIDQSKAACCAPVTAETACCTPAATTEACCEPGEAAECCPTSATSNKALNLLQSIGIPAGLLGGFLFSDYWLSSFLRSHLTGFSTKAADSVSFFISHSIGLISLLALITYLAVFARSFIDAEKVRARLDRTNSTSAHGLAAAVGVATPFCSCSAVPVFTGFVRPGVPVSQAISFLVASPLVNEIAIFLLAGTVGWAIAGLYAAMGFLIAVGSGLILRRFVTAAWTEVEPKQLLSLFDASGVAIKPAFGERTYAAMTEALDIVKTTIVYILIGVGLGAAIHGWVPVSAIREIVSWGPVAGVIAATAIGIPLYSGIATVIPIITALSEKGMPMGTLLAFSMSVTALSLPEAMLLRRVMKPKLLAIYFATVAMGIILVGILFNLILK